ncbi:MAG: DNA-directed RNA polymerase subunit alpha [Parcubacteria group bacterium GW2011_GWB1_56_8]|nr:MAG: DNA-directed RNA polymerase subunit alpha [Parcubacteria group bacterium GW2011_GWB1_56_8]
MEYFHLSSTVSIRTASEDARRGVFEIDGLYAGYGLTMGNALRRALLSSLPGAAVTYIKVRNAQHEFTTLPGVKEDIVELTLNFKKLRFRLHIDEPQTLLLKAKGERVVTAADIKTNAQVEIMNPGEVLATLTAKNAELDVEVTVERGLGYSAVESRKAEKIGIGMIAVDAFFSPVTRVNYAIENMRVGERTDYNRLRIEVETDGTVSPSAALHKTASILKDHFEKAFAVEVREFGAVGQKAAAAPKKRAARTAKKAKAEQPEAEATAE